MAKRIAEEWRSILSDEAKLSDEAIFEMRTKLIGAYDFLKNHVTLPGPEESSTVKILLDNAAWEAEEDTVDVISSCVAMIETAWDYIEVTQGKVNVN